MSLTREQVLAAKPGNQLNRMVQEHVFGWIPWAEQRGEYTVVTYQRPGEKEPYKRQQDWEKIKDKYSIISFTDIDPMVHVVYGDQDFSTDIKAAWSVIGSMRDKNWWVVLSSEADIWNATFYWDPHQTSIEVESQSAPEAICKAALLAVLFS